MKCSARARARVAPLGPLPSLCRSASVSAFANSGDVADGGEARGVAGDLGHDRVLGRDDASAPQAIASSTGRPNALASRGIGHDSRLAIERGQHLLIDEAEAADAILERVYLELRRDGTNAPPRLSREPQFDRVVLASNLTKGLEQHVQTLARFHGAYKEYVGNVHPERMALKRGESSRPRGWK